jgi:hypothetical protein
MRDGREFNVNTNDKESRRTWLQKVGLGSAGLGAGALAMTGCQSAPPPPQPDQHDLAAKAKVGALTTTPALQIFCHGMMLFELPQQGVAGNPNRILIHIPDVADSTGELHSYKFGSPNKTALTDSRSNLTSKSYKLNGAKVDSSTPSGFQNIAGMWGSNLHFSSSGPCSKPITAGAGSTKQFCTIELPMPDGYLGLNRVRQINLKDTIFVTSGRTANNCDPALMSTFLIHVFRYNSLTATPALHDTVGNVDIWTGSSGAKLHLYAEPTMPMGSHLNFFNNFFSPALDLAFTNAAANRIFATNQDDFVADDDMLSLTEVLLGQGGNVADCINGFGS